MITIHPISKQDDYPAMPEKGLPPTASPLTIDDPTQYFMYNFSEEANATRTSALSHLMSELLEGQRSGEKEGYVSSDDVRTYFQGKRS